MIVYNSEEVSRMIKYSIPWVDTEILIKISSSFDCHLFTTKFAFPLCCKDITGISKSVPVSDPPSSLSHFPNSKVFSILTFVASVGIVIKFTSTGCFEKYCGSAESYNNVRLGEPIMLWNKID